MPIPRFCRNPGCPNHTSPHRKWFVRIGTYPTKAHGAVRRYRCRTCGKTTSDQSESIHYYAKRRLPMKALVAALNGGSSLRDIGWRHGFSGTAIRNGVLRMGRQAMAAQVLMLHNMHDRDAVVFDGLRTFVTSQDYPCDITTVVDRESEVILTMTHAIRGRGGRMRFRQARRLARKLARWRPRRGSTKDSITLVVQELWDYLRPPEGGQAIVDTDEDRLYRFILSSDRIWQHLRASGQVLHRRTPGNAPRIWGNLLFPANYVDRLIRHRVKEHTRETIAFGRHATVQMHRAWIFAWEHNMCREFRTKQPDLGVHAEQGVVEPSVLRAIRRQIYERRIRLTGCAVPRSITRVWLNKLSTPPVRWRVGQKDSMVKIPKFARNDLASGSRVPDQITV